MPVSCNFGTATLKRARLHGQGWHQLFDTTKMAAEHLRVLLPRMRDGLLSLRMRLSTLQKNETRYQDQHLQSGKFTWSSAVGLSLWRPDSKPAKAELLVKRLDRRQAPKRSSTGFRTCRRLLAGLIAMLDMNSTKSS